MADGEVQINVRQTTTGNGLEATRRKIEELKRASASYEEKGMTTAASSARAEARSMERDLAKDARERAQSEREIARSRREQEAVARAGGGAGGIGSLRLGNVGNLLGIGSAATLIHQLTSSLVEDFHATAMASLGVAARGRMDRRQLGILSGIRGTSSQVRSEKDSVDAEIAEREGNRATLERGQYTGVLGMMGIRSFAGVRASKENEEEILRLRQKRTGLEQIGGDKFENEESGMALAAQRARIEGNYKEAITLGIVSDGLKRARELRSEGASPDQQRDGALMTIRQRQIDMTRGLGSLASARDGRSNIAALASLGSGLDSGGAITRLDGILSKMDGAQRKDFTTPPSNSFAR